jgi:hypothetical protein
MAAITLLRANNNDSIYLNGSANVSWTGSGTPWDTSATTPFEIANNDVTGERYVLRAPVHTPIQTGGAQFSPWLTTLATTIGNRTITIPLQARASTDANLTTLVSILRRYLFDMTHRLGLTLSVTYGSQTVLARVESGTFQETDRFWNDEDGRGAVRGVLTLECRIGTASAGVTLGTATTITNAVANTSLMASLIGDWRYVGQPLELWMDGGDIGTTGTKLVYCAITNSAQRNSSSFAESLATSSTTGATATGTQTITLPLRRATTIRALCYITSPSSNLEVRAVIRYDTSAGQAIYTGPWVAPGTSNMISDLGFVKPAYLDTGVSLLLQLQYRSTTGGATSGSLIYLYLLDYFTFCTVTPPASTGSSENIFIASASPGIDAASPNLFNSMPHPGAATVESGGVIRQHCAVAGQYPVAIRGAGIWLAWVDGGVFSVNDTISLDSKYIPLYETIASGA